MESGDDIQRIVEKCIDEYGRAQFELLPEAKKEELINQILEYYLDYKLSMDFDSYTD